jgi:hypothetical protein
MKLPNNYVKLVLGDNPKWSSKEPSTQLLQAINSGFHKAMIKAITFCENNFSLIILQNQFLPIYILSGYFQMFFLGRKIASDENSFLISDSGELLSLITKGDQAPFIYEKTGNTFENFMIDEFQEHIISSVEKLSSPDYRKHGTGI